MKKISIFLVIALLLGMVSIPPTHYVYAQSGVTWGSGYQVLNLDPIAKADISIYYYNQNGALADLTSVGLTNPVADSIDPGTAKAYATIHAPAGFNGSVVISSTTALAVIINLLVNTTRTAVDSYSGVANGAASIYFPSIVKGNGGSTTTFNIQNTGGAATTVTIHFTPEVGHVPPYPAVADVTQVIQPSAAQTFDLSVLSNFSAITKWVGSVTATVSTPGTDSIAGVASTVNLNNPSAATLASYNAFSQGSPTVSLPLISEANSGNRTGVSCQNLGQFATTIEIDYTPEPGRPAKAPEIKTNIAPMGVVVFVQALTGTTWTGSAVVKSNAIAPNGVQPLACVVNQQKPSVGKISSYVGFNPASATAKIVLPIVVSKNSSAVNGYQFVGFSLASADGASHTYTCHFAPENSTYPAVPDQVKTGKVAVFVETNIYGTGQKFVGSATCTSGDASGFFAVVNTTREATPSYTVRDTLSSYNALNLAP